jgi:hypothetical protein
MSAKAYPVMPGGLAIEFPSLDLVRQRIDQVPIDHVIAACMTAFAREHVQDLTARRVLAAWPMVLDA